MRPVRFHTDEHIGWAVIEGLRRRGIDVSTTSGIPPFGNRILQAGRERQRYPADAEEIAGRVEFL
jgi:hypothetical protein